ncbi:MAG: S-adenosylmethionine decarboxylase [Candidatus Margulisiibacteriota bacterium]
MPAVQTEIAELGIGSHLLLDCYGCPSGKLADRDFIFETLEKFPAKFNLTQLMPPCVYRYPAKTENETGISGVVLAKDAHITLHTFPTKRHVFVDLFSAATFDAGRVASYLVSLFEAQTFEAELMNKDNEFSQPAGSIGNEFSPQRLAVN